MTPSHAGHGRPGVLVLAAQLRGELLEGRRQCLCRGPRRRRRMRRLRLLLRGEPSDLRVVGESARSRAPDDAGGIGETSVSNATELGPGSEWSGAGRRDSSCPASGPAAAASIASTRRSSSSLTYLRACEPGRRSQPIRCVENRHGVARAHTRGRHRIRLPGTQR